MTERTHEHQPEPDGGRDLGEEVQQLWDRIDELGSRVENVEQTQTTILDRLDEEAARPATATESEEAEKLAARDAIEDVDAKVDELHDLVRHLHESYSELREFQEFELEDQMEMWQEQMEQVIDQFEEVYYEFKRETERREEFEDLLHEIRYTVDRVENELEAQREPEEEIAEFRTKLQKANRVSVPSVEVETLDVEPGDVLEVRIRPVDGKEREEQQETEE